MKKADSKKKAETELRKEAEKKLKLETIDIKKLTATEVRKLAHELQVYQIELDMQNEELRKSQQELENSRDRYSRLYDFAPVGYLTIDKKGLILEANLTFALMLGMERESLIKKLLSYFVARGDEDILYLHRIQVLKTKKLEMCELRMMKKDGTHFYAQLESEIVMDDNDHQCRIIVSDITKRKKMEEALLHSEKLKSLGIITAGISHEFNNLLAVIVGNAELLEGDFKDVKGLKKGLNTIIKACNDGVEIVKRMLTFASAGESTSNYILTELNSLIGQAIDFTMPRWKNMAQSKGINYHIDKEGIKETLEVFCHPTELREVFINIMNNALDAMPDGG
nr:PAS domain S-box protein [Candidatus Brocadiales bacterium]